MLEGHQCAILWLIDDIIISHDDMIISHDDENVFTKIIEKVQQEFGQESPITVTRAKKHEYLGGTEWNCGG